MDLLWKRTCSFSILHFQDHTHCTRILNFQTRDISHSATYFVRENLVFLYRFGSHDRDGQCVRIIQHELAEV